MKKTDFFGQDHTAIGPAITILNEARAAAPELHWAALVDSAFDYPEGGSGPYTPDGVNCYMSSAYEGLEVAAPWLVPLSASDKNQQLRRLLRHCSGRPMLSFLASRVDLSTLEASWQNLHWIRTGDDQRMLLRVADTRILPALSQHLSPEQWAALTSPIERWMYVNREGVLVPCPLAAKDIAPSQRIELSQGQLDALLLKAEADAVLDLLAENMREIFPKNIQQSKLYKLINDSCRLSHAYQIPTFSDTVSLAVAACMTDGESTTDTRLTALLSAGNWGAGTLGERLAEEGII